MTGGSIWSWFCNGDAISNTSFYLNASDCNLNTSHECLLNGIVLVTHVLFVCLTLIILLITRCHFKSLYSTRWAGHSIRWLLSITLLLVTLVAIAEGILSDTLLNQSIDQPQLYLPACCFFVAIIVSLVYYQLCETRYRQSICWILLIHWSMCVVYQAISFSILLEIHVDLNTLRLWIILITILLLASLIVLEIYPNVFPKVSVLFSSI